MLKVKATTRLMADPSEINGGWLKAKVLRSTKRNDTFVEVIAKEGAARDALRTMSSGDYVQLAGDLAFSDPYDGKNSVTIWIDDVSTTDARKDVWKVKAESWLQSDISNVGNFGWLKSQVKYGSKAKGHITYLDVIAKDGAARDFVGNAKKDDFVQLVGDLTFSDPWTTNSGVTKNQATIWIDSIISKEAPVQAAAFVPQTSYGTPDQEVPF